MFKVFLFCLCCAAAAAMSLVTFTAVMASRGDVPQMLIHLEPELHPGSPLPKSISCDRNGRFSDKLTYCQMQREDGTIIRIVFDRRQNVITRASFKLTEESIGTLILNWGEPQGYIAHGQSSIEIYWHGRSVFTTAPFRPSSPVYYASFQSQWPSRPNPWKGFQSIGSQ
jgi:hypothetical protein